MSHPDILQLSELLLVMIRMAQVQSALFHGTRTSLLGLYRPELLDSQHWKYHSRRFSLVRIPHQNRGLLVLHRVFLCVLLLLFSQPGGLLRYSLLFL